MLYDKHSILYTLYAMSGFEGIKLKMEISTSGEDILLESEVVSCSQELYIQNPERLDLCWVKIKFESQ